MALALVRRRCLVLTHNKCIVDEERNDRNKKEKEKIPCGNWMGQRQRKDKLQKRRQTNHMLPHLSSNVDCHRRNIRRRRRWHRIAHTNLCGLRPAGKTGTMARGGRWLTPSTVRPFTAHLPTTTRRQKKPKNEWPNGLQIAIVISIHRFIIAEHRAPSSDHIFDSNFWLKFAADIEWQQCVHGLFSHFYWWCVNEWITHTHTIAASACVPNENRKRHSTEIRITENELVYFWSQPAHNIHWPQSLPKLPPPRRQWQTHTL